jgi:unsaturated rhamnogalacturonyl hydrolase
MVVDLQGLKTRRSTNRTHIVAKGIQRRDFMLGIALTGAVLPIPAIAKKYVPTQVIVSADVLAFMEKVAKWQLANPSQHRSTDWTVGALSAGMMALSDVATDPEYRRAMMTLGQINGWRAGPGTYNANDYCIGQMYCEMYMIYNDPAMIAPLREQFDYIIANPPRTSLSWTGPIHERLQRWSWCDALFMGPPTWIRMHAVTGNQQYLDFLIKEWRETYNYLYDRVEHLWFRDDTYFDRRESNGQKVFWGRGNGWVMGGLVRVLQFLPLAHPKHGWFVKQFREMAARVLACQQSDGLWRSSLLNPEGFPVPETSGSGFFCYALAWGINVGILDRTKFEPAVSKAWMGLVDCVTAEGKLTHVQPVGEEPMEFDPNSTEIYGVGAFLLAGSEVFRMLSLPATSRKRRP